METDTCTRKGCTESAQAEHSPCCSTHRRPLCCECYCDLHFVEIGRCSPASHAPAGVSA